MKKKYILLLALMIGCSKGKEKVSEMRLKNKGQFKKLLAEKTIKIKVKNEHGVETELEVNYENLVKSINEGNVEMFKMLLAGRPEIALECPILVKIIRSKLNDEMKLKFINVVLWLDYQNPELANSVGIKTLLNMRGDMHDVRDKCEDPKGRKIEVTPFIAATLTSIKIARKLLLFAGPEMLDINAQDSMGKTALMYSIIYNNINMTKELLSGKFPIKVNIADNQGNTALAFAALKDGVELNMEAAEALLEKGADINAVNKKGLTVLNFAINSGFKLDRFIFFLLDKGANVNLADENGETPLIKAVRNGNQDLVRRLLLEKGIDLNAKDKKYGRSAIFYACMSMNDNIGDILISRADISAVDKNCETLLMYAVQHQNMFFFDTLLRRIDRVTVDMRDKDGKTALIKAIELQGWNDLKLKIIDSLIFKAGADRFLSDNDGQNPLMYLALSSLDGVTCNKYLNFFLYENFKKAKEFEIEKMKSIINAKNKVGLTVLMLALKNGNNDVALDIISRESVKASLDLKAQDGEGKTTLMHAILAKCKKGCPVCNEGKKCTIIKSIVDNILSGVELANEKEHLIMQDGSGKTYLMHAIFNKWSQGDIMTLIPTIGDIMEILNLQDKEGKTILMYAVENKDLPLVRAIVNLRVECNLKNKVGLTALEMAKAIMVKDSDNPEIRGIVQKLEEQVR